MAQRQIQAAEPDVEMRILLVGTPMPKPIFLRDEEGGAIHFLYLTFSNPAPGAADCGAAALDTTQAQLANTQELADQIVIDAIQSANLTQVSVWPRSAIYLIKRGR